MNIIPFKTPEASLTPGAEKFRVQAGLYIGEYYYTGYTGDSFNSKEEADEEAVDLSYLFASGELTTLVLSHSSGGGSYTGIRLGDMGISAVTFTVVHFY